jgi:hypothetical protein
MSYLEYPWRQKVAWRSPEAGEDEEQGDVVEWYMVHMCPLCREQVLLNPALCTYDFSREV